MFAFIEYNSTPADPPTVPGKPAEAKAKASRVLVPAVSPVDADAIIAPVMIDVPMLLERFFWELPDGIRLVPAVSEAVNERALITSKSIGLVAAVEIPLVETKILSRTITLDESP
jgi:hypothetical protein